MKIRNKMAAAVSIAALATAMPGPAYAQSDQYIGQILYFGGNFCPRGTASASGGLLSIASNTALFSLIGTTYGGDGRTTFALPDLRGRLSIGQGNGPGLTIRPQGQSGGLQNVTLTTNQLPAHTHAFTGTPTRLPASSQLPNTNSPDGAHPPTYNAGQNLYFDQPGDQRGMEIDESLLIGNTGGNLSHYNVSPVIAVTVCVATTGIFPSRN